MFNSRTLLHSASVATIAFLISINNAYSKTNSVDSQEFKNIQKLYYQTADNQAPEILQQMRFYYNNSTAWLEFTNYEFLINGKESNKLVRIFIGKPVESTRDNKNTKEQIIEIFDPEISFVFQNAVLNYWNKLPENQKTSLMDLAKAIQIGYSAVNYHFGFKDSLEAEPITQSINSPEDLLVFVVSECEKYKKLALESNDKNINKIETLSNIKEKTELGFTAYYPNPIYLGDIALYTRPKGMSYADYIKNSRNEDMQDIFGSIDEELLLSNNKNITEDKYIGILKATFERLYPKKNLKPQKETCPIKGTVSDGICYTYKDIKQLTHDDIKIYSSVYAFRGDGRSLKKIQEDRGFFLNLASRPIKYTGDDGWSFAGYDDDCHLYTASKNYISATRNIEYTSDYPGSTYVVLAKVGVEIPTTKTNHHKEIAVPISIKWEDVAGVREKIRGVVFLKDDLIAKDPENFWKLLQAFGEKFRYKVLQKITKNCHENSNNLSAISDCKKWNTKILDFDKEDAQVTCINDNTDDDSFYKEELCVKFESWFKLNNVPRR